MEHTQVLEQLAWKIDKDLPTPGPKEDGQLVRVTDEGAIALRSLDAVHPFDALLGFVAPDNWDVLGVIATGDGTRKDGSQLRTRVIHLTHRDGSEVSMARLDNDDHHMFINEPQPGRVADCVRRALNLPTPPVEDAALVAIWFPPLLDWLANAGRRINHVELAERIAMLPKSWAEDRWRAVETDSNPYMDSNVAAWMDDGMYAREMLAFTAEMRDTQLLPELFRKAKLNLEPEAWGKFVTEMTATVGDAALAIMLNKQ